MYSATCLETGFFGPHEDGTYDVTVFVRLPDSSYFGGYFGGDIYCFIYCFISVFFTIYGYFFIYFFGAYFAAGLLLSTIYYN